LAALHVTEINLNEGSSENLCRKITQLIGAGRSEWRRKGGEVVPAAPSNHHII